MADKQAASALQIPATTTASP